jgi:CIC family chloride channel protein
MGAVAAAVLGAPISTAVMIFELTGGFAFSVALLFAVSISTGLTQLAMGRSFFYWQLYTRGILLEEGPHTHLAHRIRVRDILTAFSEKEEPPTFDPSSGAPWLRPADTLEAALKAFDAADVQRILVVEGTEHAPVGWVRHVDALAAFNKALVEQSVEEHL